MAPVPYVPGASKSTSLALLVSDVANDKGSCPVVVASLTKALSMYDSRPGDCRFHATSWLEWANLRVGSSMRTCYLVDPASSHMLVSKIKPCMCKYELI